MPSFAHERQITRQPLPARLPRRVPERLSYWEDLWWKLHADTADTVADLRAAGWSEPAIVDVLGGFADWITENATDAIKLGLVAAGEVAP